MILNLETIETPQAFISYKDYVAFGQTHYQCETDFMRLPYTFEVVREVLSKAKKKTIKMLSAPSSIGLEALSLLAMARQAGLKLDQLSVTALDYDLSVLNLARKGQYWAVTPSRDRINMAFPVTDYDGARSIESIKKPMDLVMDYCMPENDEVLAIPVSAKPAVLSRISFVKEDLRTFFRVPQPNSYDLALLANVNGSSLEARNYDEIKEWARASIALGGLMVIEELLVKGLAIDGFKKLTTGPLDGTFGIYVFEKL